MHIKWFIPGDVGSCKDPDRDFFVELSSKIIVELVESERKLKRSVGVNPYENDDRTKKSYD